MALPEMSWVDIPYLCKSEPVSVTRAHLQAVLSELDMIVKDVQGLRDEVAATKDEDFDEKIRRCVESKLGVYIKRCETLHETWQREVARLADEFRKLSPQDIADLKAAVSNHGGQLLSLDSDVQLLRQMLPVHSANFKATEAAMQLLRESTERSVEGLRLELHQHQQRRQQADQRLATQQSEAQETLDNLRAEVVSLQSACKNTSATMQQIKETVKDFVSLKRDFDGLKRESEHHSSQIKSITRGMAALEERSSVKQREIKCLQSDVDTLKQSLSKLAAESRLPRFDTENNSGFVELRNQIRDITTQMDALQTVPQEVKSLKEGFHQLRGAVEHLETKLRTLQASNLTASGLSEVASSMRKMQHQIELVANIQGLAQIPKEVGDLSAGLRRVEEHIQTLEGDKQSALEASKKNATALADLGNSVAELQKQVDVLGTRQARLRGSIDHLRNGIHRGLADSSPRFSSRSLVPGGSRLATPRPFRHLQSRLLQEHQYRTAQHHVPITVDQTSSTTQERGTGEDRRDSATTVSTKASPLCGPVSSPLAIDDVSGKKNDYWDSCKEPGVDPAPKLTLAGPVREKHEKHGMQHVTGDIRQRRRVELNSIQDARCSSSGSVTPSSLPPSAMRSTRGTGAPTFTSHVSFHEPPATATRHISADSSSGTGWKEANAENPSTDFTNTFIGGSNAGLFAPPLWRDNSPAAQALDAFKTFLLGARDAVTTTANTQPSVAIVESAPTVSQPDGIAGPLPSTERPTSEPFKPRFSPPWTLPGDEPSVSQPPSVAARS